MSHQKHLTVVLRVGVLAALLCDVRPVNSMLLSPGKAGPQRSRLEESLHSTSKNVEELSQQSSSSIEMTIESLRVLLEKQEEDAKMTRQLLTTLESEGKAGTDFESDIYESFVSGFDYGFVSRSEGAGFSEVKGDLPGYGPPGNVWKLGWEQFFRNLDGK